MSVDQIAHIYSQLQPLHEAAVKSCFIHTSGNVAATIIRSSQQEQKLFTHTFATAVTTCPRDMQPQGVELSEFFVPHDSTHMFCHCNTSRQSSFDRTSCGTLQQRMLQKGRFLPCEQLRSVRPQLTERFNQS